MSKYIVAKLGGGGDSDSEKSILVTKMGGDEDDNVIGAGKKLESPGTLGSEECAPGEKGDIPNQCVTEEVASYIVSKISNTDPVKGTLSKHWKKAKEIIAKKTNCQNDCDLVSVILSNAQNLIEIPKTLLDEQKNIMAPLGPVGDDDNKKIEWLSDKDIDDTLASYKQKMWGKKFYHVKFHMRGFMKNIEEDNLSEKERSFFPTELEQMDFKTDIVDKGYQYMGCVLNTDSYEGGGKHWVVLFVDIPKKTFEYFDSVGNPNIIDDVIKWMKKARASVSENDPNEFSKWKEAPFNRFRHQKDNYDCGVFSLFYIIKRMEGIPYSTFHSKNDALTDEFMRHDCRRRFFRAKDF